MLIFVPPFTIAFFSLLFLYKFVYIILYKEKIVKITNTFSPADLQREYRKIFELSKKSGPVLVITNNRPDAVIIGYRQFVEMVKKIEDYEYLKTTRLLESSTSTPANNRVKIFYSKEFQEKREKLPIIIKKTLLKKEQVFRSNTNDPTLDIQVYKSDIPNTYTLGITESLAVVFKKETKARIRFINLITQFKDFFL